MTIYFCPDLSLHLLELTFLHQPLQILSSSLIILLCVLGWVRHLRQAPVCSFTLLFPVEPGKWEKPLGSWMERGKLGWCVLVLVSATLGLSCKDYWTPVMPHPWYICNPSYSYSCLEGLGIGKDREQPPCVFECFVFPTQIDVSTFAPQLLLLL